MFTETTSNLIKMIEKEEYVVQYERVADTDVFVGQ